MSATAIVSPAPVTEGAQTTYTFAMENYLDAKLQITPAAGDVNWTLRARLDTGETPWSDPLATGLAKAGTSAIAHVTTNYAELRIELDADAKVLARLTQRLPN